MPNPLSPAYINILGPDQLISSQINKVDDEAVKRLQEGPSDKEYDELELSMDDEELLRLKKQWEENARNYDEGEKLKQRQDANKQYYLGRQGDIATLGSTVGVPDNILFESVETFLPAALSKNPEPVVFSSNDQFGVDLSNSVKGMLQYHADELNLRLKLKRMVRHWLVYYTGCLKIVWNKKTNDVDIVVVFPQNLLLDKDGYIDDKGEFHGRFIGELHTVNASELIEMFPEHETVIAESVNGNLGTSVTYTEWSTNEYCFYTYKDTVLGKYRNPNWNYDIREEAEEGLEEDEYEMDEEPNPIVPGKNHLKYPRAPYLFFSVFNFGEHPHDETTLIEQNIPNQNLITDRNYQIKKNLENANNGLVVSGDHFNKEDAKEANDMVRRGKGIFVPSGDVRSAVTRLPAPALPNGLFQEMADKRNELRSISGVQGISPAGQSKEDTVRGKILSQGYDTSRIGGGISDQIAQVADGVFNYLVQMYYVYYDEPKVVNILGPRKALQYISLQRSTLIQSEASLLVSVAPDSMKPKDELSQMNMATDMWANGSLDPLSYYEMLNLPDPQKLLERWVMFKTGNFQGLLGGAQQGMNPIPEQNIQPGQEGGNLSATPPSDSIAQVPINGQQSAMPNV